MKRRRQFKRKFKRKGKNYIIKNKIFKYKINIIIILILIDSFLIFYFIPKIIDNKIKKYKNINLKQLIENNINFDKIACEYTKELLKNRTKPFDFENELIFFLSLLSCKIPFSFIRFGDGENLIMRGNKIGSPVDHWFWKPNNQKFRESLIESINICKNENNFISIPCKNWYAVSKSLLSFSSCTSEKYMSFATLFINKNFPIFKNFISSFIYNKNRWKIILVANSIINKNIKWAYKFYPVPNHIVENWENFSSSILPKIFHEAKKNKLIFFISAGPASNIIISHLSKINKKNIYIDFGSSIELITKGYSTRPYSINTSRFSNQSCEPFILKNKELIYD